MYTEEQAKEEAAKREKSKSKHMTHKVWRGVHDSVKGWHPALVDNPKVVLQESRQRAREIFFGGGTVGEFNELAEKMLLATCQNAIDQFDADKNAQ